MQYIYIYCTRWKDLQEIENNGLLKSNGKSHMFESRHGSSNEYIVLTLEQTAGLCLLASDTTLFAYALEGPSG